MSEHPTSFAGLFSNAATKQYNDLVDRVCNATNTVHIDDAIKKIELLMRYTTYGTAGTMLKTIEHLQKDAECFRFVTESDNFAICKWVEDDERGIGDPEWEPIMDYISLYDEMRKKT